MSDNATGLPVKQYLSRSLRLLLKPLVKLFIDQGMTHGEFCDAARESYVEMSLRSQTGNDPDSLTRVAIATGLTRREVTEVIERALEDQPYESTLALPRRLLHEWHNDSRYTGPYGIPSEIPFRESNGNSSGPSFVNLVETYTPGQNPENMLRVLLRVGAIVETDKNTYKVMRRDFEAAALSPQLIERFGDVSFNLNHTLTFNVQKKKVGEGIFDRRVLSNRKLNEEELDAFSAYLKSRGQMFLEEVDNWLTNNVKEKDPKTTEQLFDSGLAAVHYTVREPEQKKSLRDFLFENGLQDIHKRGGAVNKGD